MEEQPSPNKKFNVMDVGRGVGVLGEAGKRFLIRPAEQIVSDSEMLVKQAAYLRLTIVFVGAQYVAADVFH